MADFLVTGSDGKQYRVTGDSPEGAAMAVHQMLGGQKKEDVVFQAKDGGRVIRDENGNLSFTSPSYATSDSAIIDRIMQGESAGGAAVSQFDKQTIAQHPIAARAQEFIQGTPIVGEFLDEVVGVVSPQSKQGMDALSNAMERERPWESAGLNMAGAIATTAPFAAAAPALSGTRAQKVLTGAQIGAATGAVDNATREAGRAAPGDRIDAAQDGFVQGAKMGALFGGGSVFVADVASAGLSRMLTRTAEKPTVEGLRAAKTAAYRAVDDAGEVFSPDDIRNLVGSIKGRLDDADYVGGFGQKLDPQIARLEFLADKGQNVSLLRLDDIRSRLWKAYRAAPDEVEFLDVIKSIDDLIDNRQGDLMKMAREANARFRKAELLTSEFQKAADQTASTGSGGNILNKYRQVVTGIINNQKKAQFFSETELSIMRDFVHGGVTENALRKIGKLSPNGNGLMQALNLAAIAVDPTAIAVSAAATGAKAVADRSAMRGAENLVEMVGRGGPVVAPQTTVLGALPTAAPLLQNRN